MSSVDKKHNKMEAIPVDADGILAQREMNLKAFYLQKQNMDTLIKMIGKVTESITGEANLRNHWCFPQQCLK